MGTTQQHSVAVKRVRRKTVSTSGAKRGRPPFVQFNDGRGKKWRIYFHLPEGTTEVPRQMILTSQGDQHQLNYQQDNSSISVQVVASMVVATDPVAELAHSGALDAGPVHTGHCSISSIEIDL
jgi:hypothetical protein